MIGGLAALVLACLMRIPLPPTTNQRWMLLLSGFCGFVGFPVLFTLGIAHTSANHASMILASLPIFTGAIALLWDKRIPKPLWWLGCTVALAGEFLLIGSDNTQASESTVYGDMLVLVSNLFASLGYVVGGRLQQQGYPATGTTFWGAAIFSLLLLPIGIYFGATGAVAEASVASWLAIAYLAIGVTIVGYVCWYWALGKGGIARVGLLQFLQPISGVILAWILLAEYVDLNFLLSSAIILFGVWIALKAKD